MKYRITRHTQTGGYVGAIDMPLEDLGGQVSAIAIGRSKFEALRNAAHIARRMAESPGLEPYLPARAAARADEVCGDLGDLEIADDDVEVGILPFLVLAQKYGPGVAKAATKAWKSRKAAKAAKRAADAARAAASRTVDESAPSAPSEREQEPESSEDDE